MPTQPPWLNPSRPTGPVTAGCLRSTASASRSSAARSSSVWVSQLPGEPPQPARSWVSTTAPSSAIRSAQPPQSSQQPSPEPSTSTSAATGSSGTCTSARSSPTVVHSVLSIGLSDRGAGQQQPDESGALRVRRAVGHAGHVRVEHGPQLLPDLQQLVGGDRQGRAAEERRVLPLAPARAARRAVQPSIRSASRWAKTRSSWSVTGPLRQLCSTSVSRQTRSRRSWPGAASSTNPYLASCRRWNEQLAWLTPRCRPHRAAVDGPSVTSASMRSSRSGCASARTVMGSVIRTMSKLSLTFRRCQRSL